MAAHPQVTSFIERRVPSGFSTRLRVVADLTLTDEGHTIECRTDLTAEELVEIADLIYGIAAKAAAMETPL
jgi:hypothetical protein